MDIFTERLQIRRIKAEDWQSLQKIWEDQSCSSYARFDRPSDTEPEAVRKRTEKWASAADSTEHMAFAVCLEETLIGYVVFNARENGYEVGYCFHSDYHGKGYAAESIGALISYVQGLQPGAVISAGTALENVPSMKLLNTLGFRQIGTERLSFYKDDRGQDIYFEGGIFEKGQEFSMDRYVNDKDFELLSKDPYTFDVLSRILPGKCDLILSDHQNFILCHSASPYPVWIWTEDGCPESVKEKVWDLAEEYRPLEAGFEFNIKYDLAAYFMERGRRDNLNIGISMQLCAYNCLASVAPTSSVDGKLHCCSMEDAEIAAKLLEAFYEEIGEEIQSPSFCMDKAKEFIGEKTFYFWKNAAGEAVSCCSYNCNQGRACIKSGVYAACVQKKALCAAYGAFRDGTGKKSGLYAHALYGCRLSGLE